MPEILHSSGTLAGSQNRVMQVTRFIFASAELTKMKLTAMATLPALFAWFAATPQFHATGFIGVLLGVFASASGAAALNQWTEWRTDARMARTSRRPLPSGRLQPEAVLVTGLILLVSGILLLALTANLLSAALVLFAGMVYWLIYTPLKKRTRWCTEIGAISGAVPPLIGWAAATGTLSLLAWILFAILFLWQMPHFHPIAWRYREDYRNAGLKMRAVVESTGNEAANHGIAYTVGLVALGFISFAAGEIGFVALVVFFLLSVAYFFFAARFRFAADRDRAARNLFKFSLIYLPVILIVTTL
ncbi:MAG: heme o synthase [Opitutales bacterium]